MKLKSYIIVLFTILSAVNLVSQNGFNLCKQESSKSAYKIEYDKICLHLSRNNFLEAEKNISDLLKKDSNNISLVFLMGVCNSYNADKIKKSISNILACKTNSFDLYNYHLAYAYQVNDSLKPAIACYKKELKLQEAKPAKDKQIIELINLRLQQCENLATIKTPLGKTLLVNTLVTIDNVPSNSEVDIRGLSKYPNFKLHFSTKGLNGNFICHLPTGDKYEFTYKAQNLPPQVIELNTEKTDTIHETNMFVNFISPDFDKKVSQLIESTNKILNNKSFNAELFASKYGTVSKPELVFKVQVGAFKFFENFSYTDALEFPKIIRQTDNDYITRFTMGNYTTYTDALALLNRVHEHKVKDAFIIAFYKGEKKYLHQLVNEKIISN